MAVECRQKIELELTESEADCLLNWVLYMGKMPGNNLQHEHSSVIAILFARLVEAFPTLMADEDVMLFWEQNDGESESVPSGKALIVRERMLKQIEQHLQAAREFIKAELTRLNRREELIECKYASQISNEEIGHALEKFRLAELERRLRADAEYQAVRQRKQTLSSELANQHLP